MRGVENRSKLIEANEQAIDPIPLPDFDAVERTVFENTHQTLEVILRVTPLAGKEALYKYTKECLPYALTLVNKRISAIQFFTTQFSSQTLDTYCFEEVDTIQTKVLCNSLAGHALSQQLPDKLAQDDELRGQSCRQALSPDPGHRAAGSGKQRSSIDFFLTWV